MSAGRVLVVAATAGALLVGIPASAFAQEPVANDPAAQKIDAKIGDAVAARNLIGVTNVWASDDPDGVNLTLKGTFSLNRAAFYGQISVAFTRVDVYSTTKLALARLPGSKCWKRASAFSFGGVASLGLASSDPMAWIDKTTTGPAIFSIKGPQEIAWALGGTTPATATETYNPTTMLPLQTEVVQTTPATASTPVVTTKVTTKYRFSKLSWKAPKKPKRCR